MPFGARFTLGMIILLFGGLGLLLTIFALVEGIPVLLIPGLIMSFIAFTPLYLILIKKHTKQKMLTSGQLVMTDFVDVTRAIYAVNGWQPYLIRSEWYDQVNHIMYRFKSGPITDDPSRYLTPDMKIPVYLNPQNPKQHYMDMSYIETITRS